MDSSVVNETTRVLIAVNSNNTEHKYGENPLKIFCHDRQELPMLRIKYSV